MKCLLDWVKKGDERRWLVGVLGWVVGLFFRGGLFYVGSWGEENEDVEEVGDVKMSLEVVEEG